MDQSKVICRICGKTNEIRPGPLFNCCGCSIFLQHVACPHCRHEKIWLGEEKSFEGQLINCENCEKDFRFFDCLQCEKLTWVKNENPQTFLNASCGVCQRSVRCAQCYFGKHTLPLVDNSKRNASAPSHICIDENLFIACPHCSTLKMEKKPENRNLTTTSCETCAKNFTYQTCGHCGDATIWKDRPVDLSKSTCAVCRETLHDNDDSADWFDCENIEVGGENDRDFDETPVEALPLGRCFYADECTEFLKTFNLSRSVFNPLYDQCYCSNCYPRGKHDVLSVANFPYVVPRKWAGFSLNLADKAVHQFRDKYIIVYHGTTWHAARSIVRYGKFFLPGDLLPNGKRIRIRPGHIPGKTFIYTTPSIHYASFPVYSESYPFRSPKSGKTYRAQVVLQVRQKVGTFRIQGETIGAGPRRICRYISNNRIEHFTTNRSSVIPYRLLVRLREV